MWYVYSQTEREQRWQSHQQTSSSRHSLLRETGYNPEEVDAFLEQLSSEVDAMLQKIADLKGRLTSTEQQLAASTGTGCKP